MPAFVGSALSQLLEQGTGPWSPFHQSKFREPISRSVAINQPFRETGPEYSDLIIPPEDPFDFDRIDSEIDSVLTSARMNNNRGPAAARSGGRLKKKGAAGTRPARGVNRNQPPSGPPKPRVRMNQPGYPSIQNSIEQSSLAVSAPTNRTNIQRTGMPSLQYRANGDCAIRHREYISEIAGSVAFTCTPVAINPGLSSSMPWLSRIANNFESYNFRSLRFAFETEAASTAIGNVILAVDYDATDAAPTTKTQALSYRAAVRSSPWVPCVHTSLREDLSKRKTYRVRSATIPANTDLGLFDVGTLHVITTGMASAANVGELWVEYDIVLMTPKTNSAGGGDAVWGSWTMDGNVTGDTTLSGGNLPATLVDVGGNPYAHTWTFTQPWQGAVSISVIGTGIGLGAGQVAGTALQAGPQLQNNGAGTAGAGYCILNAIAGQTFVCNPVNTTITSGAFHFTQGFGAFG